MRILNLGSLNIDSVYSVPHFVSAGETIKATKMDSFCGGKGLNQSLALARAGANVFHAGAIGMDGARLEQLLLQNSVDIRYLSKLQAASGNATIQISPSGGNCIVVFAGANGLVSEYIIDHVLDGFTAGDCLLLQNEVSNVGYTIKRAKERDMFVIFNPSPITDELFTYPLSLVDLFILNEIEGQALVKSPSVAPIKTLDLLSSQYPDAGFVLTLGADGVLYRKGDHTAKHDAYKTAVVDTTAAGDTFCGYFLAALSRKEPIEQALQLASAAAAIAISRQGAAPSIPAIEEVSAFLNYNHCARSSNSENSDRDNK